MKKIIAWFGVLLVASSLIVATVVGTASVTNTYADSLALGTDDLETIKQNALYKSIYSNLVKCYSSMQSTINESPESTWASFNSNTYFSDAALASDYLKFPYGVGSQNQSSCPKMITGWKTNWFVNLFTGTGSYDGVLSLNINAEVPDSSWYDRSTTKMGDFLKNIGYTMKTEDDGSLSNRSCFYLKFKLNQSTYDNNWLPKPADGEYLETVDYCVKLNNDGTLSQSGDSIIALIGNNEYFTFDYDNGHLTDESNIAFIYFNGTDNALAPQFRHITNESSTIYNQNYLQSNLNYIDLRYYYATEYGNSLQASSLYVQNINSPSQASDNDYCWGLGYTQCWSFQPSASITNWFPSTTYIGSLMPIGGSISYSDFKARMTGLINKTQDDNGYYLFSGATAVDYSPVDRRYEKGSSNSKFINYFIGDTSRYNAGKFSDAEKYMLYYTYLKNNYNVATSDSEVGSNSVRVSWLNEADGTFSKLYIYDPDENLNDKKYILGNDGKWDGATMADWHQIAELLAAINVESAFDDAELNEPIIDPGLDPGTTPDGGTGTGSDLGACFGQASSLGWILCPVVQLLGDAVDKIYDGIENQFLYVNPELTSSASGTHTGWEYFRNFANIAFVIVLTIIIISQVTGLGISNYGIKKTLPTLIIVAILVNISFFVCQLLVDASNIVGYSLKDMFESLSIGAPNEYSFGGILNGIVGTLMTGAAVGVAGAAAVAAWPAWLLPLVLVLIGTVISILFFYLLLGVRQAGIVILIVISPLAIICYALPNTKKLFTRWWQMFSSLLVLFPICGALMGGGIFASSLLLHASGGTFFFYFVAVLLQVVPFFFIPTLLRSSMSALGNLGVRMANMGNRLGRSLNRSITGTDSFRDAQRRNEMRNAERTFRRIDSGRDVRSRLARGMRRIGASSQAEGLEAAAQRRRARAISKYDSSAMEDLKARVGQAPMTEGSNRYDAMLDRLEYDQLDDMAKSYMSQYKKSGKADSETAMETEYQHSLAALMSNPEDRELRARVLATQRILSKSDSGRGRIQNSLYAATANGGVGNEGHRFAHSALLDESGDLIKSKSPGFHSYLTTVAGGGNLEGSFTAEDPNADNPHYRASAYDGAKIGSLEGNRLAGLDEVALDRMLDSAQHDRGGWTANDVTDFDIASRNALLNSNINTQGKVGRKINNIRRALGLNVIEQRSGGRDSGTIDLRNGNSSNRGGNGGPTIRTGNDDRSARGDQSPSPLRDTDDWRPNNDHGGIILPPGMT